MNEFKIGMYIKKRREELGMSQEELCEGLCAVSSLSRIENNQQDPSRNLTKNLLERLGLPNDRFLALWDQKGISTGALLREISDDMIRYERTAEHDRPRFGENIREKLAKLEKTAGQDNRAVRQFLLAYRAILGRSDGPYSTGEKLAMQLEAIRMTCPRFDPEDFRRGHYSLDETRLINQIAKTYSQLGESKRATDMYDQLLKYVEKNDRELAGYAAHFCLIAHNYAINLGKGKRYEESIEIAEKGRRLCISQGSYQFLPGFLAIQAENYYFLGEIERSKELYLHAYYLYNAYGDAVNREAMRREMREYLNMEMSEYQFFE